MRVVVEVCSGPSAGRQILLRDGQSVQFGRSVHADFEFPDTHMSSLHFSLEVAQHQCRLRDLQSTNGTKYKGQFVKEALLEDGDTIIAGETKFAIHLTNTATSTADGMAVAPMVERPTAVLDVARELPFASGKQEVLCDTAVAGSGFHRVAGPAGEEPTAWQAVWQRAFGAHGGIPMTWIVDRRMATEEEVTLPGPALYLFGWMLPEVAGLASPQIVTPPMADQAAASLYKLWGQNAMVGFVGKPDVDLPAVLRLAARSFVSGPPNVPPKAIWGFCWPHVMRTILDTPAGKNVERLLATLDGVMVESQEGGWLVYARESLLPRLKQSGIHTIQSNSSTTETNSGSPPAKS